MTMTLKKNLTYFLLTISVLFIYSCSDKKNEVKQVDPAFSQYVSGFTSGVISRKSEFVIRLVEPSKQFTEINGETKQDLFDFSPFLDGKAYWRDQQTIVFIPEGYLQSGITYDVEFELGEVVDVKPNFEVFEFSVVTKTQSFSVNMDGITTYESQKLEWNKFSGNVKTADFLDDEDAEKLLKITQNAEPFEIKWVHDATGTIHEFYVDSVERKIDPQVLFLEWDGDEVGIEVSGELEYEIPSLNDFKLMEVSVVQQPEQHIKLSFSDPLKVPQDLKGLIRLQDYSDFKFEISGNIVKAYPKKRLSGVRYLMVETEIRNAVNFNLQPADKYEIEFIEVKPLVRINGEGVILPSTDGLIFPFEAVNLSAVDVKITRIFENNILQFLQTNSLGGSYQMSRVGKAVLRKKVNLTSAQPIDYGVWNNFSLDLSELIQAEPGAIYRVSLSFKKSYSMYPCEGAQNELDDEELSDSWDEEVRYDEWDYYDEYDDDYGYYDYDWNERDNPCDKAYYRTHRGVSKNILASNIGLMVKSGKDRKLLIAVNDIRTAKPLSGVELDIYNYQNQKIGTTTSSSDGLVWIDLSEKPFLLVATKGTEKGYLKLDDGVSLSMSHFDVSGQVIQDGIKGYIFGERGVWRPGDTLFLNFILEDENDVLPSGHPVKLELIDPRGQLKKRMVKKDGLNDFYHFKVITDPDDITGSWLAKIKVGGATFSKYIRIETVKPNRLKIKYTFDNEVLTVNQSDNRGELAVQWLHGATAKNLKAKIAVTLSPGITAFDDYPEYQFRDIAKRYTPSEQVIFEGKIDHEGKAVIQPDIKVVDAAPGMLRASFVTRVFEEGGDYSIDRFTMPYSPFKRYVGVKLPQPKSNATYYTDSTYYVDVVTVNENGKPIDISGLEVRIYKLSWRWWWDVSHEYLANYTGNSYKNLVSKTIVNTKNGTAKIPIQIEYPDWGRYLVRVIDRNGGHSTGTIFYVDWPAWVNRGNRENPGGASVLSFSTDQESYKVGEEAKIVVPTSVEGRALVTIENGTKVIDAQWLEVSGGELLHTVKITPEMAPNAYVNVTLVQPHAHENNLPIRMYGVMPIKVEDPDTKLEPVIQMPDELGPETDVKISIREKEGKPMTYVVAMVDEGLLDLTRFKTPKPHANFYAREALGVKTWDMYDEVIGAYGGEIERILSIGGDEGMNNSDKEKVNRFKPMVKFIGPFVLKSGGENEHVISIPNYVGSVRTMVIAAEDERYGSADKTTPVKKPLMVLATLPRVLGPGEKVKLPVTVFAMDKKVQKVKVRVKANGMFKSDYVKEKMITFKQPDDQVVTFDLEVLEKIGKGTVHVEVSGAGEKASYDIELAVRNPNPPMTKYIDAVVYGGKNWQTGYQLFGVEGTNSATLELSNMPPVDFERRLKYLLDYPHGCVEQTTSRAFPQLYLKDVMDAGTDQRAFERASDNVKAALDRLRLFQNSEGGFGFWPGAIRSSDWGSTYVGHFIIEAEAKGFVIPSGMKDKWTSYQKRAAKSYNPYTLTNYRGPHWRRYLDMAQAYRLYTLAMVGAPEMGAMNRLKAENDLDDTGLWRLATAYYLAGQKQIAEDMVSGLSTYVGTNGNYTNSYTYGSVDRDQAMILESMSIMGKKNEALTLSKKISNSLTDQRWMSTQTTAYCLMAMVKFAGENGISKEMKFAFNINNKQKDQMMSILPLKMIEIENYNPISDSGRIELENRGKGLMYARVVITGTPTKGEEVAAENNLKIQVKYTNMSGEEIDVSRLEQGMDFMAEVTITNPNAHEYVNDLALTQIFPSGWEIHNTRMDEGPNVHEADVPEYQDIRDDRVYTYFSLSRFSSYNNHHSKTFRILLNAAYLGEYYLPAVKAESMYDNRINANEAGQWVKVVKPGEQ